VAPADDDAFESAVVALVPTHAAELLGFLHQRRPGRASRCVRLCASTKCWLHCRRLCP
jgi:hypothetical protein